MRNGTAVKVSQAWWTEVGSIRPQSGSETWENTAITLILQKSKYTWMYKQTHVQAAMQYTFVQKPSVVAQQTVHLMCPLSLEYLRWFKAKPINCSVICPTAHLTSDTVICYTLCVCKSTVALIVKKVLNRVFCDSTYCKNLKNCVCVLKQLKAARPQSGESAPRLPTRFGHYRSWLCSCVADVDYEYSVVVPGWFYSAWVTFSAAQTVRGFKIQVTTPGFTLM